MAREPDVNGPAFLRAYRSLAGVVDYGRFADICVAQDLPKPSGRMYQHVKRLYRDGHAHYVSVNTFDQWQKDRRDEWSLERVNKLVEEQSSETERIDFKREVGGETTHMKAWAAMANAGGGDVIYGIEENDSRAEQIQPVPLQGITERIQQLNEGIDPPVRLTVRAFNTDGPNVGVVCVRVAPASPGTVHLVGSRAPIRSGTTTRYMTSEEIRRWIREAKRPPSPEP